MGNKRRKIKKNNNILEEHVTEDTETVPLPSKTIQFWDLPSVKSQLDTIQYSISKLDCSDSNVQAILMLIYEHLETISTHVDVLQREVYGEELM